MYIGLVYWRVITVPLAVEALYPTSITVSAIWPKCMGVHSLIWLSVLKAYGSFKCVCKIELYVMSDKSEQKYSQRYFVSDQSVFAEQFAFGVNAVSGSV